MRKATTFGILVLVVSIGGAFAWRPMLILHAAVTGELPVAGFKPGRGIGGLGTLEIGSLGAGMTATATSGYLYSLERGNLIGFNRVPILGGFKFGGQETAAYISTELGAVLTHSELKTGGSDDETNLGWDIGLGKEIGPIDLRVTFNDLVVPGPDAMSVGLTLGFRLWDNI